MTDQLSTTDWLNECREALIELRDQQALPRKAASYQRQIDELDAHIATQGWQPMETAPRDGTPILVFDRQDQVQTTASWREDGMRHLDGTTGQFYLCCSDAYSERQPVDPTCWKPLGPNPETTP